MQVVKYIAPCGEQQKVKLIDHIYLFSLIYI